MRQRTLIALLALLAIAAPLSAQIDARMLRMPDVSQDRIAFVYAGDIWVAGKEGGTAHRLSTPRGEESFPRFSPDGASIAFTGNYDGNQDVYVMPAAGGLPVRVTHHPMPDRMLDWYPGGDELLYASFMTSEKNRFFKLYKTAKTGGLPEKLPVPYGEYGAISPDGKTLAYLPHARDHRTWKRYRGGLTSEIWLVDLEAGSWRNLTEDSAPAPLRGDEANDSQPMWHGDSLYFVSDRGEAKRWNIWVHGHPGGGQTQRGTSGETRQVTHFTEHDIHFPAIGPSEIVFEHAGRLHLLDLASERTREIEIDVVTDRATLRPRTEKVAELIASYNVSPSGKRAVFEARGEIFTVPAEHGFTRNLTRSSGVAERHPAWSPDGKNIAYFSDRSGEYELTVRPADGSGEETTLTTLGPGFRYFPMWSPDSQKIAFVDEAMNIRLYDLEAKKLIDVDRGRFMYQGTLENFHVSWSADSRFMAYHRGLENQTAAVFLFDTESSQLHQVTSGVYPASQPAFDPGGKYLYFLWGRSLVPAFSSLQFNMIFANITQIAAVPLRADVASPLAVRNDEEEGEEDSDSKDDAKEEKKGKGKKQKDEGEDEDEDEDEDKIEPVKIDIEGFESRIVVLPAERGNYFNLRAVSGKVVYMRLPRTGTTDEPFGASTGEIVFYDLEEREEKTVVGEADGFEVTTKGDKVLFSHDGSYAIVDLKPDQKPEKKLAVGGLETTVDPPAEWRQLFADAWRFERDFFYDPGMHGVDWPAMRQRYGALLGDAVTRWDVNFVIGEMIGELNASHTYRGGGDQERPERRGTGLLGVDFQLEDGHYRFLKIIDLPSWETEVRSPLRQPGIDVKEGDYLLAVGGTPVDPAKDPWAAFGGLAEKPVMLTVNSKPSMEGAREVLVETLGDEQRLRNLAWIEAKRKRVEEASGGRIGYVFVPDTAILGHTELIRQFRSQFHLPGLIVDERFNNGGFSPSRLIELLNRPRTHYRAVRNEPDSPGPSVAHHGAQVMLINSWAGSGGDMFPYAYRAAGLGPLIGTRTWGGVIGLSGSPALIDGGGVTVPTHGMYDLEGNWVIEGYGVDPDIEVLNDPVSLERGVDPQLERGIEEVLKMLEENPPSRPEKPPYPDRSGV